MSFGELGRLVAARESLRTALRSVFALAEQIEARVKAGATLEEVQGQLDLVRSEFDKNYAQLESIRTQARALEPPPQNFLAELNTSLDVNRPRNYQTIGEIITKAGQNTNKRNADIADKAAADQGPQTSSAGTEVTEAGAATQAPAAAGQQQDASGAVTTAPTTLTPTNAEKFQPAGTVTVPPGAPALPGPASPTTAGAVPPATGTQIARAQASDNSLAPAQSGAALSYIYKAVTVTSTFERGRFTQDLEGVLLIFPEPPRKTVYRDSDDNLAWEYTADDNLAYEGRPGSDTPTTPSVLAGPVTRQPNAENLAQLPESSTGNAAPTPASTDTIAPARTAPATSEGQTVATVTPPVDSTTPVAATPTQNMARES